MQNKDSILNVAQLLAITNQLQVKAFNATDRGNLIFIILNDTFQVFKYDRSLLWDMTDSSPKLLGISGMHKVYNETEIAQKWTLLLKHLKQPADPQVLTPDSFTDEQYLWEEIFPHKGTMVYWIPIKVEDEIRLGFWIERWHPETNKTDPKEDLKFLTRSLMPGYASAWAKFDSTFYLKSILRNRKLWYYSLLTCFVLLFAIRLPLRVAAPCEIVPVHPFVVTAPLDGILHAVSVQPGQEVKMGELLFDYDKTVPLEELKVAQKQVQISQAELNRANTLGLSDPKSLAELEILRLKLQKDQIALQLAQYQSTKLQVQAAEEGVVMIDDPDEWRGKPVKIGEKVLTLSDPEKTKLRFWVPENDNILLDQTKPISVILNIDPARQFTAKIDYISFESRIGEDQIPSFMGEANWETTPKDIKIGLRGTAVLYGERVSLFYFLIRKPWSTFRRVTGF